MKKTVINIVIDYRDMDQTVMNRFTDNVYICVPGTLVVNIFTDYMYM